MDDIDMLSEIALMYCVAYGLTELTQLYGSEVCEVSSLESNAVGCGVCFLRDELRKLWEAALQ